MSFIGIGKCSKYNIYILIAIIIEFMLEHLFGLNPNNKSNPLRLLNFSPKIYNHLLLKQLLIFIGIFSGGIIIYFLHKKYNKRKEGEISINRYERMKKELLGEKIESKRLALIIVALLFTIYNIMNDFLSSALMGVKFWMFEIIYISILSYFILKIKINTHRKIAIIIMIGPLLIIDFISLSLPRTFHNCQQKKCSELTDKNTFDYIKIKYGYSFIPLIFIFNEIISLMKDYSWVKSKYLMDIRSVQPYKVLIYIGVIGSTIIFIFLFILTFIPCDTRKNIIKYKSPFFNVKKFNNYTYYDLNNGEKIYLSNQICSLIDYNNNTHILNLYYDSISLFFKNYKEFNMNDVLEIFILIPLFFILNMIKSYCHVMIIRHLDPNYILIIENFFCFIRGIIRIIANKANQEYLTNIQFFLTEIQEFIYIISNMIYIEIIELKFCNLDYDLKKNIGKRSDFEYLNSGENFEKNEENDEEERKNIDNNNLIIMSQSFEE